MPTKTELMQLYSGTEAVLSDTPRAFSDVQNFFYWSSSSFDASNAWVAYMPYGNVANGDKGSSVYVWPVRSGQ